ncbi:hypothetical protein RE628_02645 [Paenibacillus sp. D2_2]|uniref:hypothetical protein n=1 Tax=Paenibacillus sp. D2_2 TaxID=3073092 RepID=UPI002814D6E1|nr:hypothetical protein [Paenibacillus sp. D2_2]WMT41463.1 hypothetical protein RE628_02645 [Paenibacillus sp. D2_2]
MKNLLLLEYKMLYKNNGWLVIGGAVLLAALLSNPVLPINLAGNQAVSLFTHHLRTLILCSMPLSMALILKEHKGKLSQHILFSQPIRLHNIALGKWLAIITSYFFCSLVSLVLYSVSPLLVGHSPYDVMGLLSAFVRDDVPAVLIVSLFSGILYILLRSKIVSYVGTLLIAHYVPAMFHLTLLASMAFILLLAIYVVLYSVSLNKDQSSFDNKKTSRRKVRKICSSYHKAILLQGSAPVITVMLFLCMYAFISKDHAFWSIFQYIMVLLPSCILIPIHSEVYGNKRAGYIYTSNTPRYKIMLERFAFGTLVSESLITLMYMAAFLFGLENGIGRLLILYSSSLLLAVVGLTAANITRNSMTGYIASLLLWGAALIEGTNFEGELWTIVLIIIAAVLFILNVSAMKGRNP